MIKVIIKKELKEIVRSGQFKISLSIVLVLTALAIAISAGNYRSIQKQHTEAMANERNVWESQGDKNPHSAAHYGTYAFKPKHPISLIDQGVDKFVGISIYLGAHSRSGAEYMAAADQTGLSRFGDLTPDFILLFIIPLLIILFGHNSFTKEKEKGTLRLTKSQGAEMTKLALGKWVGTYIPIGLITITFFTIAGVLLSSLHNFGQLSWQELLFMMVVYLAYYAIFNSVTLIFSALSKNSGIALVSLLAFWIISCLAAPKAATNLAELKHPFPTKLDFNQAIAQDKSKGIDGHNPWNKASKELEAETLKAYNVSNLEDLPFNFDAYRMQKGEEHDAQIYFKHYAQLKDTYRGQSNVYRSLAAVSPYLPVRFLSMSLAHTDYGTHWHFSDATENYRIGLQKALNTNFAENSRYGDWDYKADKSLWAEVPEFDYKPQNIREILTENQSNLIVLSGWLLISFIGLIFSTKRL